MQLLFLLLLLRRDVLGLFTVKVAVIGIVNKKIIL